MSGTISVLSNGIWIIYRKSVAHIDADGRLVITNNDIVTSVFQSFSWSRYEVEAE